MKEHYATPCGYITHTLQEIARGRKDNGRALAAEKARQLARKTLSECLLSWPSQGKEVE